MIVDGETLELREWLLIGCLDGDPLMVLITERGGVALQNMRSGVTFVPPGQDRNDLTPGRPSPERP